MKLNLFLLVSLFLTISAIGMEKQFLKRKRPATAAGIRSTLYPIHIQSLNGIAAIVSARAYFSKDALYEQIYEYDDNEPLRRN